MSDKGAIAFSGQDKVPILVDGQRVVCDSWRIADYLEASYPQRPTLFGGAIGQSVTHFVNAWVDRQLIPRLVPLLMVDVLAGVDEEDASHLRRQIEKAFGHTLEELAADRDRDLKTFRRLLDPARAILRSQAFLSGPAPAYADYILFSLFQWTRIVSDVEVLEESDPLTDWRGRMLGLFKGLAIANEPLR